MLSLAKHNSLVDLIFVVVTPPLFAAKKTPRLDFPILASNIKPWDPKRVGNIANGKA